MNQSMQALIAAAEGRTIFQTARAAQAAADGVDEAALDAKMMEYLTVMREAAQDGMHEDLRSFSGMVGGMASLYACAAEQGRTPGGTLIGRAASIALAIAESNACMGRIVAAPTAGACGILPGVLLAIQQERNFTDEQVAQVMFTAAAVGQVIANRASISGAEGGCQAECGSAAAMAASALTELMGGTPQQAANALCFALMSLLGLVCDPVGGLVEIPCVYRNATGAAVAIVSADMALANVRCPIPADEMIDAMGRVGKQMPASLRETGEGGCASCPSVAGCAKVRSKE